MGIFIWSLLSWFLYAEQSTLKTQYCLAIDPIRKLLLLSPFKHLINIHQSFKVYSNPILSPTTDNWVFNVLTQVFHTLRVIRRQQQLSDRKLVLKLILFGSHMPHKAHVFYHHFTIHLPFTSSFSLLLLCLWNVLLLFISLSL